MQRAFGKALIGLAAAALTIAVPVYAGAATGDPSDIVYTANPPHKLALATTTASDVQSAISNCVAKYGLACYTPADIQRAYNIPSTLTGAGQTIIIVDAYGSPTIQQDLAMFDSAFGLPPANLNIIYPAGQPSFNPQQHHDEAGWAEETSLDVEWAHAIAPAATIDLVIAPNNYGNALNIAERYAVEHHLGNVMSMSFGSPEAAIRGAGNNIQLQQSHAIYQAAQAAGITVFASSGDQGATNYGVCPKAVTTCDTTPNASYPASDPLVTAVGGTNLFYNVTPSGASASGYQGETVWNDADPALCPFGCQYGPFGATGGAPSFIFPAPSYQSALSGYSMRTTSDVAYNASVYTGILVYLSIPSIPAGFYFFGGTSEGAPQWAAITALADQAAGHALGFLNPRLYAIGANPAAYAADFHDVTVGNNGFFSPGFPAKTGYDLPTGLGTPNVANLIASLAKS